jgi:HD-GYP domain-containing protein (c-di-GMP phosphodiesterase class II)
VTRRRPRALELLEGLALGPEAKLHPSIGEALARDEQRRAEGLVERRERIAEGSLAVATLVAGVLLVALAPHTRDFDPWLAAALVAACAVARRVRFYDGGGYAMPTQLVLVPMLLLLPPATVPLLVAAGMTLGNVDRLIQGKLHPQRLALCVGDALHSVGPALVLVLAGPARPAWSALPVYALALAAQFGVDLAGTALRDWFVVRLGAGLELRLLAWTWLVDTILATVGLLAALAARDEPYGALLVLPLMGLLNLFSRERSARLEQSRELSRAYRGTTLLLSDVLDEDDEYTGFHSRGVVQLSLSVAHRLGLDERQKRNVEFGALLHDVGKIAIPKEILHKPGTLSRDEWLVMETHTLEGQRLLDRVGGVLGDVGRIVRASHERWDGTGYPDGIAGDAIPQESAIVSACDAFNAMTTDRPYRPAIGLEAAIVELRLHAGTQFSPRVVDALLELIDADRELGDAAQRPFHSGARFSPKALIPSRKSSV